MKLNSNNYAYIPNDYIILNDELYKLFAYNESYCKKETINYFYENKRLFIYSDIYHFKNSILMYHFNNNNEFEIKVIFYFFTPNSRDDCIIQIKEIGYDQYQGYLLFNEGELVSPIFDTNQNLIGNAYKYDLTIKDYSKYNISFEIRKIFLLYLNYQILLKKLKIINDNKFKEYYAVNKNWMQKYKDYYDYDKISAILDQNNFIQMTFNNIITNAQNTNFNLNDKLIALMMKQIPKKFIDEFIKKDRCFSSFRNDEMKIPNISHINYNGNNTLMYYIDFELISKDIYEYLFNSMNKYYKNDSFESKAEMVECIFDNKYIVISFPKPNPNDKKYMIEIGNIDNKNIYNPEYFLLYDQYNYLCEHVQNIINTGGFNEYFEVFKTLPVNTLDIKGNQNQIYGIAIKKNINLNYNMINTNQFFSGTNVINNNQYAKIQHKNTIHIKEGQNIEQRPFEDKSKLPKKLYEMFPWPPRVGLDNIGATCYMNATLQCFCQIEEFVLFFKYDKHIDKVITNYTSMNKDCLTTSFKILIEKIWPDEAKHYESKNRHFPPNEFRKRIADMSPLFVNNQANDAKDLVNFIIMTLHEELNENIVGNNMTQINNFVNPNNNNLDLFTEFYEEYKRTFRSKISELFYAIQQTETKCLNCQNSQFNYQAYFFLVFPLEEVKKHAINNIYQKSNTNMNMTNNNQNQNFNMNNMFNIAIQNNFMNMPNNMNFNNNMPMNNFGMNMMGMGMGFNGQNFFSQNQNNMFNTGNNNFNQFVGSMPSIQAFTGNNIIIFPNNNANFPNFQMQNLAMQNFNNNFNTTNNVSNQDKDKLNKLNNNIVTIMDCFEYNQKIELFTGTNQIYCNKCNQMANANYNTILTTAPKVLILLLNRGVGIQFKIKLEFTTELDITNYVIQNNGSIKYKLVGVITHLGESGSGGHFIAHCLSPIDNQWYTYNDAIVSKTDDFQKQIIDLGMPYLLFYKLIELNN